MPLLHGVAIAFCCCFCIGGALVMATYARLYLDYTQTYSDFERRRVWSIWYHADTAWILVLSATLSAIGFVYFSIHMVLLMHAEAPDALPWGLYVYGLFLLFSAMYAPLLAYERVGWVNAWAIVGCLVAVACNAVALSVWTQQQWKWSEAPFLNLSVAWLAAHCTLLDLGVWGYAWSNGWIWPASSAGGIMHEEDGESVGEAEQYPCLVIRYV